MIITNSTPDKFYFDQLISFLASMRKNSLDHTINVFLANYPDKKIDRLHKAFPEFVFENRKVEKKDKRGIALILFRIELVKECFEKYKKPVAWIDTDVIVRADLSPFLEVKPKQLKILFRGGNHPRTRFNAGIFNIGYSEETYKLVCDWRNNLKSNLIWGMGQLELWKAYNKHKDNVELIKMPKKFNDLGSSVGKDFFRDDSLMWHCKKAHFNNPKFQKEFQKYFKIGKELFHG